MPLQVLWGRIIIIGVVIPLLVDWGWQGTVVPFKFGMVRDEGIPSMYIMQQEAVVPLIIDCNAQQQASWAPTGNLWVERGG